MCAMPSLASPTLHLRVYAGVPLVSGCNRDIFTKKKIYTLPGHTYNTYTPAPAASLTGFYPALALHANKPITPSSHINVSRKLHMTVLPTVTGGEPFDHLNRPLRVVLVVQK